MAETLVHTLTVVGQYRLGSGLAAGSSASYQTPGGKSVTIQHLRPVGGTELNFAISPAAVDAADFPSRIVATKQTGGVVEREFGIQAGSLRDISGGGNPASTIRQDYEPTTGAVGDVFVSAQTIQVQLYYETDDPAPTPVSGYPAGYWAELVRSSSASSLVESATGASIWLRTSDGEPLEQQTNDAGRGWVAVPTDTDEPDHLDRVGNHYRFRKAGRGWIPSDDGIRLNISEIPWNGGTTYRFFSVPEAPTETVELFDTPGAGTWTVPSGVTSVKVELVGGGGGRNANQINSVGGDGGSTTFDGLTVAGGGGARFGRSGSAALAGSVGNDVGGTLSGRSGARDVDGLSNYGHGALRTSSNTPQGGGGAYARVDSHSVTPGESITYSVGAGGAAGVGASGGGAGVGGAIRLTYTPQTGPAAPNFEDDTGDAATWEQNTAITEIVVPAATGNPKPTYAVEGGLPAGITYTAPGASDDNGGTIQGAPTALGSGTITIRATNTQGSDDWTLAFTTRAPPPPGVLETVVGDGGTSGTLTWNPRPRPLIPASLVEGGGAAYLDQVSINNIGDYSLQTTSSASGGSGITAGPELTSRWENYAEALTISAGSVEIVIPGPNFSGFTRRDVSEPYSWSSPFSGSYRDRVNAFFAAYQALSQSARNGTRVELRDRDRAVRLAGVGQSTVAGASALEVLRTGTARLAGIGQTSVGGSTSLTLTEPAPVRIPGGIGSSAVAADARPPEVLRTGTVRIAGIGETAVGAASALAVTEPGAVRLAGVGRSAVTGTSEVFVGSLRLAGIGRSAVGGASALSVTAPGAVRLAGVGSSATGAASALTVTEPPPVRIAGVEIWRVGGESRIELLRTGTIRLAGIGESSVGGSSALEDVPTGTIRLAGKGTSTVSGRVGRLSVTPPARTLLAGVGRTIVQGRSSLNVMVEPFEDAGDFARGEARSLAGRTPRYALEITHPEIDEPIRVVADNVEHMIEGERYLAIAFRAEEPQFKEGEIPRATLEIDNVGKELTQWVETTGGGRGARIRVMKVHRDPTAAFSHITWELPSLAIGVSELSNEIVSVQLVYRSGRSRPGVKLRHDPTSSPGLF